MMAATMETLRRAPEIGELRQDGLLPKIAQLMTRLRAVEEKSVEVWDMLMTRQSEQDEKLDKIAAGQAELYEMFKKILRRLEE
jgi:hypothetical protein